MRVPWTARRANQSILKDQPWDFFGRNDAKAEAPVLWPLHVKSQLIGKDPELRKIEGRRRRGRQDEMAGWHHGLDGRESE